MNRRNHPKPYTLVYFPTLQRWGELTGKINGAKCAEPLHQVQFSGGADVWVRPASLYPEQDHYIFTGEFRKVD